ncbi:thiamine phosphate synthase [Kiloniella sp. b19]|uniref:thiamine phosphate synthase n=1 Tax=Kiloniella sp. GXU_MW_B19 TaxID=3141326 RepID=UPI0031D26DE2
MACQLYLVAPDSLLKGETAPDDFIPLLQAILKNTEIACFLLPGKPGTDEQSVEMVTRLCSVVQDAGVAFLLEDAPEQVRRYEADGVHLGDAADFKTARAELGPNYIVGVDCGVSRHAALVSGDGDKAHVGADYVAFNNRKPLPEFSDPEVQAFEEDGPKGNELLQWWQTMMTVPCVAMDNSTLEDAIAQAESGADFIAVQSCVWSHSAGPEAALAELSAALQKLGD